MNILKIIFGVLNTLIIKGYWYNNIKFQDCRKFWGYKTFNTDVVNLGSTSAVCAFDYDGIPLKCANWALSINPLLGDMAILKNYFSYLKEGATIIIPLCPFSSLAGSYSITEDRYYSLLYPSSIPSYSLRRHNQIKSEMYSPIYFYSLFNFLTDIKYLVRGKKNVLMNEDEMNEDAERRMDGWMREFSIISFSNPLSLVNQDSITEAAKILNDIVRFCHERLLNPCILLPPVYHTLGDYFTSDVKKKVIDSLVNKIEDKTVWYHNYMNDPEFSKRNDLFQNSFLLNKKGAEIFTKKVLNDIGMQTMAHNTKVDVLEA